MSCFLNILLFSIHDTKGIGRGFFFFLKKLEGGTGVREYE